MPDSGALPCDFFRYPDPKLWPADAVERFRGFTEPRTLLDLFIFDTGGEAAAMYMEDATTALAAGLVGADEWFTDAGYPSFVFGSRRIAACARELEAAGYRVWLMEKPLQSRPHRPTKAACNVIDIGVARQSSRGLRKWA